MYLLQAYYLLYSKHIPVNFNAFKNKIKKYKKQSF